MPAFQRKQRVLGRKQLQGALPAAFLVLAAQSMAFLPGARFDYSHRDFAAGEHGLDCPDGPAGMLRANLLQLLIDGTVRPHEPAYDPEPDSYVTWDYCRGYADASLNEARSDADGFYRRH